MQEGNLEGGLLLLERAHALAPASAEIRLNLAKALLKGGRQDAAKSELQVLAKLDSREPVQQEASKLLQGL